MAGAERGEWVFVGQAEPDGVDDHDRPIFWTNYESDDDEEGS